MSTPIPVPFALPKYELRTQIFNFSMFKQKYNCKLDSQAYIQTSHAVQFSAIKFSGKVVIIHSRADSLGVKGKKLTATVTASASRGGEKPTIGKPGTARLMAQHPILVERHDNQQQVPPPLIVDS